MLKELNERQGGAVHGVCVLSSAPSYGTLGVCLTLAKWRHLPLPRRIAGRAEMPRMVPHRTQRSPRGQCAKRNLLACLQDLGRTSICRFLAPPLPNSGPHSRTVQSSTVHLSVPHSPRHSPPPLMIHGPLPCSLVSYRNVLVTCQPCFGGWEAEWEREAEQTES